MEAVFDYLISPESVIIKWGAAVIGVFSVYYGFRLKISRAINEKKLYEAYLPMFMVLAPYLYKDIKSFDKKDLVRISKEIVQIVEERYELIDSTIIYWSRRLDFKLQEGKCAESEIDEAFLVICTAIDKHFERIRRKLFLPR